MKIALELHGTIRHGVWSAERGESRWAQNLAALLASAGHEVIGFGPMVDDGWGICPRIPNLTLVDWSREGSLTVDALFDSAHWAGKPIRMNARHVLLGYFSGGFGAGEGQPITKDWPANWHLMVPYMHLMPFYASPENPQRDNKMFLPYVMLPSRFWRRYAPETFPIEAPPRNRILWGSKDPFGVEDRMGFEHPLVAWGARMLTEVENRVRADTSLRATFLGIQQLDASYSKPAEFYEARARAEAIPGSSPFAFIPFGKVLALMRESLIAYATPMWGSFALECVAEGCLPLVWDTNTALCDAAESLDLLVKFNDPPERLSEVTDRMLYDASLRARALKDYAACIDCYQPEFTLKCWERIEQKWLR